MGPADSIIEKLGGVSVVARAAGVHRTRVSNWKRPKEDGGTGGTIPQKHIPALLALADAQGITLEHSDFFPERPAVEATDLHGQRP